MDGNQVLCSVARPLWRPALIVAMTALMSGAMPAAKGKELPEAAKQQEGVSTRIKLDSAGGRDSINLRYGGLSASIDTKGDEKQLTIDAIKRTAEASEIVVRDAIVRIRASSEQISPITVWADQLRLRMRLIEGEQQVFLGLTAEGSVRMDFGDADARCSKATVSVQTSSSGQQTAPSPQEYAELILEGGVDISRVREKDRLFLDGEQARIWIGANGFSLQLSNVPLLQPFPGNEQGEEEAKEIP